MTIINNPYQTKLSSNETTNKPAKPNPSSPLDILLNAAKTPTLQIPPVKELTQRNRQKRSVTGAHTTSPNNLRGSFQTQATDLISKSNLKQSSRLRSQSTRELPTSTYSQDLKKKGAITHISHAHRNFEVNNKTPFNTKAGTAPASERRGSKEGFSHNNPFIHDIVYPSDISKNINNFIPQLNTQKTNVEKLRNINAKCEFLHSLYARQRNHYINTYKANNDLISGAFSTIKSLKDELAFALTHCKCKKGGMEHSQPTNANTDSEPFQMNGVLQSSDISDLLSNNPNISNMNEDKEHTENVKRMKLSSENNQSESNIEEENKPR